MKVLSFFIPVAGWILWAVKKNTEPDEAKDCAKWAWIGFAVSMVLTVLAYA